jgi:hypothetical protein
VPFQPAEVRCDKQLLQTTLQAKAQAQQELEAHLATTQQHAAELLLLTQESADCQAEIANLQQHCNEALRAESEQREKASALQQQKTAIDAEVVAVVDATKKAALGMCRVGSCTRGLSASPLLVVPVLICRRRFLLLCAEFQQQEEAVDIAGLEAKVSSESVPGLLASVGKSRAVQNLPTNHLLLLCAAACGCQGTVAGTARAAGGAGNQAQSRHSVSADVA